MPSSVVDDCPGSTRNAVESKVPCAVILILALLAALGCPALTPKI